MHQLTKAILCPTLLLMLTACGLSFDKRMKREAEVFTQTHCPQIIDPVTTLDSTVYDIHTRTYIRYYSLPEHTQQAVQTNKALLRTTLLDELMNDASWKTCKDEGINFKYVYHISGTSTVVATFLLTAEDYQH